MQSAEFKLKLVKSSGRILVIQNDLAAATRLKRMLQEFGYVVAIARSAAEGLKAALNARPDLILSDIELPDLDGHELLRRLQRSCPSGDIPVFALTGQRPQLGNMARAS